MMAGMTERMGNGREWEWYSADSALEVKWLWPIREYMRRRQATLAGYVAGITIYELSTVAERMEGSSRFLSWWYQEHGTKRTDRDI